MGPVAGSVRTHDGKDIYSFSFIVGTEINSVMAHPWLSGQSIDQDTVECAA